MSNFFATIGQVFLRFLAGLGVAFLLLGDMLRHSGQLFLHPRLLSAQVYNAGVLSLLIITVSSLFVGMVLALQGYNVLSQFGSNEMIGYMVTAALMRELGPVVTALLVAGRAGSALTAEIGIMKATEQLAGLEMMAVNPVSRIYLPRFIGGVIAMPILAAIFIALGIFGGYLVATGLLGIDSGAYWSQMQSRVDLYDDVLNGMIKSVVFGFAVSWIAIYQGIASAPTSEGISRATTRSVVYASLVILGLDFILTALMFGG